MMKKRAILAVMSILMAGTMAFSVAGCTKNKPNNPENPNNPSEPNNPNNPTNPDNPNKPDTPDKPDKPDKPDNPDNPEKPEVEKMSLYERADYLARAVDDHYATYKDGEIFVAGYYNALEGGTEAYANCYEYSALITMANKILAASTDEAQKTYYKKLLDGYVAGLDNYEGKGTYTSTHGTRLWENLYGVHRQTIANTGDVSTDMVYDDLMWIIRDFIEIYHTTGDATYIQRAEHMVSACLDGWDSTKGGIGGITWGPTYESKHTCSNGPLISALCGLADYYKDKEDKITADETVYGEQTFAFDRLEWENMVGMNKYDYYLKWAKEVYNFTYTYLRDSDYTFIDLVRQDGAKTVVENKDNPEQTYNYFKGEIPARTEGETFTYNTGSVISGAAWLYRLTGDENYLTQGRLMAEGANHFFAKTVTVNGEELQMYDCRASLLFNEVLMQGFYDLAKASKLMESDIDEDLQKELAGYVNVFKTSIEYAFGNYVINRTLPQNYLQGWLYAGEGGAQTMDTHKDVKDAAATPAILAMLAQYETEHGKLSDIIGEQEHKHSYTKWGFDPNQHWKECPEDGEIDDETYEIHHYDGITDATCNDCGYEREVETDPTVERGTLSGTVTAYGKNLGSVIVSVNGNSTVTGATGKYSLSDVAIKDGVTITFSKKGYATVTKTINAADWADKKSTLDAVMRLEVETGTLTGTVTASGSGISGATVAVDGKNATTNSNGEYTIEGISVAENGEIDITVTASGYRTYNGKVSIEAGKTEITKDIELTAITIAELGNKPLKELNAMTASDAVDYSFLPTNKGGSSLGSWTVNTSSYDMANEGILFHEAGQNIASGSTELKLYAYKRLTFNETEQITVRARRFDDPSHNANLQGGGYPEVYIILVSEDGTVITPQEEPGKVVCTTDDCDNLVFTLSEKISGNYVFAVGTTRGNRVAIESVQFRGEEITGTITGTVKQNGAAVGGATVTFGDTNTTTNADGSFSIEVKVRKGDTVTIDVGIEGASKTVEISASQLTNGSYNAGEIVLSRMYLPGLTSETVEQLEVLSGTKFETKSIYDNWKHDNSGITKTFNEGSGFERSSGKTDAAYYYAKFQITNDNKFMKGNWFIFNRGDEGPDQDALLQVKVITADGDMVVLPANKVFCGGRNVAATSYNADNKILIVNNIGSYTEGVYDLSAYVGQTITIIIQEVSTEVNKRIVTVSNEIAFQSTNFYAAGTVSGVVKDASGNPLDGVSVSANGSSATTNANGEYSVDVAMNYGNSVTVTFAKVGYEANSITVSGSEIEAANGEKSVDDVTLTAAKTVKDVIEENIDSLTALSGTTFGPADNGGASGWTKSSAYNVNRDICIPLGEYIYAKVNIDENHKYMKFNARDTDNQGSKMLVMVYVGGELIELAPWRVYGTTDAVIEGNYLINNRGDGYNEGIYDFSEWAGQEIVIVIQTAACLDGKTNAYTQCNEIAFGSVKVFDKGDSTNYYAVSDN